MNQNLDDKPMVTTEPSAPDTPATGAVVRLGVTVRGVGGFLPAPADATGESPDVTELPETD
jgi:hypothetical protein